VKATVSKSGRTISEARWGNDAFDGNFEAHVGRAEDCHVRVDDPLVSRHLVRVRQEGAGFVVERSHAQSEVTINGEALGASAPLHSGDVLRFAGYQLQFDDVPAVDGRAATVVDAALQSDADFPEDDFGPVDADQSTDVGLTFTEPLTPPASGQETLAELPADDLLTETMSLSDEGDGEAAPGNAYGGHAVDDLNFGGEEDVIGSLPADNSDPSFNPETGEVGEQSTETETGFGDAATGVDQTGLEQLPAKTDDGSSESTQVLKRFATFELHLFGEFAPYDRYVVDGNEVLIGRDAIKCQIVLMDPEVSSIHAIVRRGVLGLTLEDQNSSNGTLLNGQRINKADLTHGDEFVVGSTTFTVHVSSDLLEDESDRLMPVESGQIVERIEEVEEEISVKDSEGLDFAADEPQEKSVIKRILKDPKKKRIAMILGVLLLVAYLMEAEQEAKPRPKPAPKTVVAPRVDPNKKTFSPEQLAALEASMRIAEAYIKDKQLAAALAELEKIMLVDPEFKNVRTLHVYVKEQNAKIEEEKKRLAAEEARAKVRDQVKEILREAKAAVDEHNVARAEKLFGEIMTLDPENIEVTPLRQELDLWLAQQKAEAEEKARKEAARRKMVDQLAPGKAHYLRKEWYRASVKLDEFLQIKQMDEDLIKEATEMLADARAQIGAEVGPLLGKARSLKEGQDLKGAYEAYLDVLRIEPTNVEALNEVDGIRGQLEARAKKVYREAIISESLSLFGDAKEKLQEVQQVSPTDSEYYKKATEKLKDYLE